MMFVFYHAAAGQWRICRRLIVKMWRAVYGAKVPVICGIGHERDECLAEFVADVRASTPSNAAERAVPSRSEISGELNFIIEQMEGNLNYKISNV